MKKLFFTALLSAFNIIAIAQTPLEFVRFNDSDANIRRTASTTSSRLVWKHDMLDWSDSHELMSHHEPKGTIVQVFNKTDEWTCIAKNGIIGWVFNSLVDPAKPINLDKSLLSYAFGNEYESYKWLDNDYLLFTEHGGEGSQVIHLGKLENRRLMLFGQHSSNVYVNQESFDGFNIKKVGVNPYHYYDVHFSETCKKPNSYCIDISTLSKEEARKVAALFDTKEKHSRYYFKSTSTDSKLNYCDVDYESVHFEINSIEERSKLKAACKSSHEFDAKGEIQCCCFDIDRDGKPEILLEDSDGNKALALSIGKSGNYKLYNLGIFKTSVAIIPPIISAAGSVGTGVAMQKYIEIKNSRVIKEYDIIEQYNIESNEVEESYRGCSKSEVEDLRQRINPTKAITFNILKWYTL